MLFNKTSNGQEELKALLGFLYASNEFANIETDITLAEEDIIELIGQDVYDLAHEYYHAEEGEGGEDEEGEDEVSDETLEKLVKHIQLPVALYAWYNFSQHLDVSHGEDGRKVRIDAENEKIPWEWMITRDDDAVLNKAHKTTDRLIKFLEDNAEEITAWSESAAQQEARSMFINTARDFDRIFPIDRSRRFFIKITPFIREAENKFIKPVLTEDLFDDIKEAIVDGDTDEYDNILQLVRTPLAFFAMSIAVQRLSVSIFPNGILQEYSSDRQTAKATKPADNSLRSEIVTILKRTGDQELEHLQKYLDKLAAEEEGETYTPDDINRIDPDETFVRL
jgi:hypothetical protein